jgi:CMD domain protein
MSVAVESTSVAGEVTDVINLLAAVAPGSKIDVLRAQRPEVLRYAEGSYRALVEPEDLGSVSRVERELIALYVAVLTSSAVLREWHHNRLHALGAGETAHVVLHGNLNSPHLTPRQQAILRHTERVTTLPAASTATQLAELTAAGLSPRDIVTVSQLIAFLSFQLRTLVGLRVLAEEA